MKNFLIILIALIGSFELQAQEVYDLAVMVDYPQEAIDSIQEEDTLYQIVITMKMKDHSLVSQVQLLVGDNKDKDQVLNKNLSVVWDKSKVNYFFQDGETYYNFIGRTGYYEMEVDESQFQISKWVTMIYYDKYVKEVGRKYYKIH